MTTQLFPSLEQFATPRMQCCAARCCIKDEACSAAGLDVKKQPNSLLFFLKPTSHKSGFLCFLKCDQGHGFLKFVGSILLRRHFCEELSRHWPDVLSLHFVVLSLHFVVLSLHFVIFCLQLFSCTCYTCAVLSKHDFLFQAIFALCVYSYSELTYNRIYTYPKWAIAVGWTLACSSVLMIPVTMLVQILTTPGSLYQV